MYSYWVQACSARHKIGQWIQDEELGQGKDFIQKLADWEDGRLAPQNNHLVGVWMLDYFMDQRWGQVQKQSKKGHLIPVNRS